MLTIHWANRFLGIAANCYTLVRFDRAGQLRECAVRKCVDWGLREESL